MSSTGDHFTSRLPTKRVANDESPRHTAQREVAEEVGLNIQPGRVLAVDCVSRRGDWTGVVAFLFDGGVTDAPASDLALQAAEICRARFVGLDEAEA